MDIVPLADRFDLAPTLARWHGEEWADLLPDWGHQPALAELMTHTNRDEIPVTLVGLEGDRLLGSVSLIKEDLPGWEHLTPWLASVFVAQEARGMGVGTQLVEYATRFAARLGHPRLHLFTGGQEAFYLRLGWVALATTALRGHPVTVMTKSLTKLDAEVRPFRTERHHS
jgi:predicted N-acetyltransferase YhbS